MDNTDHYVEFCENYYKWIFNFIDFIWNDLKIPFVTFLRLKVDFLMWAKSNVGEKFANELSSIFHLEKVVKGIR